MKKGFTLIELLAVIVILAIIALIATPIVLNIINDTKESAVFRSAEYYMEAVEQSIMKKSMDIGSAYKPNKCIVQSNGDLLCDNEDILVIEVKGGKPTSGEITFKDGQINNITINISGKDITQNSNGKFEYYLAPGLYDKNDKLILSWEELVTEYDFKNKIETGGVIDDDDANFFGFATIVINKIKDASKLVIDESVTSIGDNAFDGCYSLTSITIPESVTNIGYSAFSYCESLTSITIPSSVTSIGDYAFASCSSLTSIAIPSSVMNIGDGAFNGCRSLTSIKVDENNIIYDSRDNSNAIIETSTNTLIVGCKNTVIPNNITSIGGGAFYGCSSLTSITIPSSVTSIGGGAFHGCSSLTSVTIPESVTNIGNYAFSGCRSLTSVTIPESVTSIGYGAFQNCISLTSITIPESVTNIGDRVFNGCSSLKNVTIENGVTSIGYNAFDGCSSLTSITIPSSVTHIRSFAFEDCNSLTTIYYKGTATGSPWAAPNATVVTDF